MAKTRQERLDDLTAAHNKTGTATQPEVSPDPQGKGDGEKALDFDDPVTQEGIINPEGSEVELSCGKIKIYPPSAMVRKMAYAFCQGIIADVIETRPTSRDVFALRILSKIMGTVPPQMQLYRLISYMLGKPGAIDEKSALEFSTELAERTLPDDVAVLFERLSVGAGIGKPGSATAKK